MNTHKDMDLRNVWFQKGEYKKLIDALNENNTSVILDIIFDVYKRGDL